jgi:hypothetical protein
MYKRFEAQLTLATPIKSRDKFTPLSRAMRYIYTYHQTKCNSGMKRTDAGVRQMATTP